MVQGSFVHTYLADALLRRGWAVQIVDDLSTGGVTNVDHLKEQPNFSYLLDTVMNRTMTLEAVDRADVVYHLAAAVGKCG